MIPNVVQNFPPPDTPIVDSGGKFTQTGRYLLLALFNRTGMGSGIPLTVGEGLTATGSSFSDSLALADDINEVTATSIGGGVQLFPMQPGMLQIVFNGSPIVNLNVYPAQNYVIDALGTSIGFPNAYVLATLKTQIFICYGQTQIRSVQLG